MSKLTINLNPSYFAEKPSPAKQDKTEFYSRRVFLKSLSSLTALWVISPKMALASLRWENSPKGVTIKIGHQSIWQIDTSWLSGNPQLDIKHDSSNLIITLSNAIYPGLNLPANFVAKIDFSSLQPIISLEHGIAKKIAEANFVEWLSGKAKLIFYSKNIPAINIGKFSKIPRQNNTEIEFGPSLNLVCKNEKGWQLSGLETDCITNNLEICRPAELFLIQGNETSKRSHLILRNVNINPQVFRDDQREICISKLKQSVLTFEVSEDGDKAFKGETTYPILVTGTDNHGNKSNTLGLKSQYARMVASNGNTESYFIATQGQTLAQFDQGVIKASPIDSNATLSLYTSGDSCNYDCRFVPQSITFPSDQNESISIHFKKNSDLNKLSGFDFFSSHEIPLDNAELNIIKPATAMWLRFRFKKGFHLKKTFFGKLKLSATPDCRLHLILQPQALLEEAFYEATDYDKTDPLQSDQTILKQADLNSGEDILLKEVLENRLKEAKSHSCRPSPRESEVYNGNSKARIATESQLVFKLSKIGEEKNIFDTNNPFSLDVLLSNQYWDLVVTRDAASSEIVRDKVLSNAPKQTDKSRPPEDATYLELPWGLYISPVESILEKKKTEKNLGAIVVTEKTTFLVRGNFANEKKNSFTDIFRLEAKIPEDGLPMRAIGARGFNPDNKLPEHYDAYSENNIDEFRTALDYRDRHEIVWLTSEWKRPALEGTADVKKGDTNPQTLPYQGIYVPKPFYAEHLILSSLGGSMESYGRWDPPALEKAVLSVERWEHRSTFARDNYDAVYYKGFLLPFGNRCTLIKITQRTEHRCNDLGVVSIPVQKFFLEISDPIVTYGEFLAPYKGRTWPFRQIELTKRGKFEISNPSRTDINNKGQSAFKVCTGANPTPFDFEFLIDGDHQRKGIAKLAFIDNEIAHNAKDLEDVISILNNSNDDDWNKPSKSTPQPSDKYSIDLQGSKVTFAPSKKIDDTSYVTHKMFVKMGADLNMVNTALVEASRRPPTFAEMESADIIVPSINRLTDKNDPTSSNVIIAPLYRDVGFDENGNSQKNRSEIFLEFTTPISLNFAGKGNRSGGVATPNLNPQYLSRKIGLAGPMDRLDSNDIRTQQNSEVFNVLKLFSDDAKLLGVIPLSWVLDQLGLDDVPKFIETTRHTINEKTSDIGKAAKNIAQDILNQKKHIDGLLEEDGKPINNKLSEKYKTLCDRADSITKENDNSKKIIEILDDVPPTLADIISETENLLRNPATLLPGALKELSQAWNESIEELSVSVNQYVEFAKVNVVKLQTGLEDLKRKVESDFDSQRAYLTSVLNDEISEYITLINQSLHQNEEEFFDVCFNAYVHYSKLYSGAYGALVEINTDINNIRGQIEQLKCCIEKNFSDLSSELTASIMDLDNEFRIFGENEKNRSFFRRLEPSLDDLHKAYFLLKKENKSIIQLTEASKLIQTSTNNISQAINRAINLDIDGAKAENLKKLTHDLVKRFSGSLFSLIKDDITKINDLLSALPNANSALSQAISELLKSFSNGIDDQGKQNRLIETTIGFLTVISLWQLLHSSQCSVKNLTEDVLSDPLEKFRNDLETFMFSATDIICDCLNTVFFKEPPENSWLSYLDKNPAILTKEIVCGLFKLSKDGRDFSENLRNSKEFLKDPTSSQYQDDIIKGFRKLTHDWHKLLDMGKRLGEAPDRIVIQELNEKFIELKKKFIPAETRLDFNFKTDRLKKISQFENNGGKNEVQSKLELTSNVIIDLLGGQSQSSFKGTLSNFKLVLFEILTIDFNSVSFEAKNGSSAKLNPPDINFIKFEGDLHWVNELSKIFEGRNGPYITPGLNGIKAGYRFDPGLIAIPPMIIQNMVIDASFELPYDNRAALTTFALSSRQSPALLFISPYGGACFLSLTMAGDRLVNAEASFEVGIVSGFDLGGVVGSGRITIGIYYRQNSDSLILEGFFFAGGNAVVLNIASIYAALRIGLSYKGNTVNGYGQFSVDIGSGPFKWTLSYGVGYQANSTSLQAGITRLKENQRDQLTNFETDAHDIFFNDKNWQLFKAAFADI